MSKVILVTGATGKQGGAVVNALLARKDEEFIVLAVTRDALKPAARKLKAAHPRILLVEGDLDDVPSLLRRAEKIAEQPVWGVYSVQVSMGKGVTVEGEISQGKALIDESIKTGVRHFVYSSVERGGDEASWQNPTPVPHFQTKHAIEHHLLNSTRPGTPGEKMGWTILRPVAFMDNLVPGFSTKVFISALRNRLGDKKLQWVATVDIGIFAAKAFANPTHWNRKAVGLAGDELNFDELNQAFESATGHPAPVAFWLFGSALTFMVKEMDLMIGWFATDGYRADVPARRTEHAGMLTMGQWLMQESSFELAL
ncbi:hypothetical protein GGR50DRAFT_694457 [Xylaria sp. CBS 124048]|nr:hypothetical protein GGR50DRAFT_694457 [Xylaria sp. CBS 124048]